MSGMGREQKLFATNVFNKFELYNKFNLEHHLIKRCSEFMILQFDKKKTDGE